MNRIHDEHGSKNTALVDRPFQEQIWTWLVAHRECRVGLRGEGNKLTLSEAESWNLASSQQHCSKSKRLNAEQNNSCEERNVEVHGENERIISLGAENVSEAIGPRNEADKPKLPSRAESGSTFQSLRGRKETPSEKRKTQPETDSKRATFDQPSKQENELRVYASEDRMWHAVAGHGVDHSKLPRLNFICLSIIAAAGPEGILQPDLVRISEQDKRSVPRRTQHLADDGYIIKRPILTSGSRTSLCILKRYAKGSGHQKTEIDQLNDTNLQRDKKTELIFNECFPDNMVDMYALTRTMFDILNDVKIIMIVDLKRKLVSLQGPLYKDSVADEPLGRHRATMGETCCVYDA